MVVGMIIIDCRSTIEIWMGGVLSRRLIFHFPRTLEYRGKTWVSLGASKMFNRYLCSRYCLVAF